MREGTIVRIFGKSAFALGATLAASALVPAQTTAAISVTCNNGTLTGLYTYHINGFNIVAGESLPTSSAGYSYYKGDGTSQGRVTTVTTVKGKTVTTTGTFTGTYKVMPNCAVKEIDKDENNVLTHYDEFTTPSGATLQFIQTDKGAVASGVATRD
jgi:hypothetical protein